MQTYNLSRRLIGHHNDRLTNRGNLLTNFD
jgi:hypothetical protein